MCPERGDGSGTFKLETEFQAAAAAIHRCAGQFFYEAVSSLSEKIFRQLPFFPKEYCS